MGVRYVMTVVRYNEIEAIPGAIEPIDVPSPPNQSSALVWVEVSSGDLASDVIFVWRVEEDE